MNYSIQRNGFQFASVRVTGKVNERIMDAETVSMKFERKDFIDLKLGDYVTIYGKRYFLTAIPQTKKIASNRFEYTCEFQSIKYRLGEISLLFPDSENILTVADFSVMVNAADALDLIVENANRADSGWTAGTVSNTVPQNITFSNNNLLNALATVAEVFDLEYWVDADKTIHLTKQQPITGIELQYGKDNGLTTITRQQLDDTKVVTRLYAYGSTKNLSPGYRLGADRLRFDELYMERNVSEYGVIEQSEIFEDIYPHRVGTVTAVDENDPFVFFDTGIDFDMNSTLPHNGWLVANIGLGSIWRRIRQYFVPINRDAQLSDLNIQYAGSIQQINQGGTLVLIPGVSAKVTFNTGQLAGYTFEIAAGGYTSSTKRIKLLPNEDEEAIEVPSEFLRPAVGDKYVITDIIMPESYVIAAENKLKTEAINWLLENSVPKLQYHVTLDPVYLKQNNIEITLGGRVKFIDEDFNLNKYLRITAITRDLKNPYDVQLELSEVVKHRRQISDLIQGGLQRIDLQQGQQRLGNQSRLVGNVAINASSRVALTERIVGDPSALGNATLAELAIPATAPIRTIDAPKIESWNKVESDYKVDMQANPLQVYLSTIIRKRK